MEVSYAEIEDALQAGTIKKLDAYLAARGHSWKRDRRRRVYVGKRATT